jgi:pyruvate/2-oxoglutarate dehydrogenase complex dihydrolipoamide acyltransferase (E2) component
LVKKKVGDTIKEGDILAEIETDKASWSLNLLILEPC